MSCLCPFHNYVTLTTFSTLAASAQSRKRKAAHFGYQQQYKHFDCLLAEEKFPVIVELLHTSLAVRLTPDFQTSIDAHFARIRHAESKHKSINGLIKSVSFHALLPLSWDTLDPVVVAFSHMNEVTPSHMSEVSGREELSVTGSLRMLSRNDFGSTGCYGNSSDKGPPVYIGVYKRKGRSGSFKHKRNAKRTRIRKETMYI